jgi:hypothetical protein
MKEHELKVWTDFYPAIESGEKTFELRFDDRAYHAGDILLLREWDRGKKEYTGRWMRVLVNYLLGGIGLAPGWVCMAIKPITVPESGVVKEV